MAGEAEVRDKFNPAHADQIALAGMPLRYMIGADAVRIGSGMAGVVTEVPWDYDAVPPHGEAIAYCNLLDEKYDSGVRKYAPYLHPSRTAADYNEGLIDLNGAGFGRNVLDQFDRRKRSGFKYIELDNPDSYPLIANLQTLDIAQIYGLKVIAKNPGLGCTDGDADRIVAHPNVVGIIVEVGAGNPDSMNNMRTKNNKIDMPCWFVFFGPGQQARARRCAALAKHHKNMFVSISPDGEYTSSVLL